MAMPTSGCIGLRQCITGIACSSISCAVAGFMCSPASLCALSVQASKSVPHAMREFYNYPLLPTTIDVNVNANWEGTIGRSNGFCGTFRLMCGLTTICSCLIDTIVTTRSFDWLNVPSGTYCVNFTSVSAIINGGVVSKTECWDIGIDNGNTSVTTPFNFNTNVFYQICET